MNTTNRTPVDSRRRNSPNAVTHRTARSLGTGLLVVAALVIGTLFYRSTPSMSHTVTSAVDSWAGGTAAHSNSHEYADGELPATVSVFDEDYPGVANLDADLLAALQQAASDASTRGVTFNVNSGWRSTDYQDQLFGEAVAQYGSAAEAARWVATADTSIHVSGEAVDIGDSDADAWLSKHGSDYGLCQIYANEAWHFELRPKAATQGCPAMYSDAAHDPRLQ